MSRLEGFQDYSFLAIKKFDSETLDIYFDNFLSLVKKNFCYVGDDVEIEEQLLKYRDLDESTQHLICVLGGFGEHTLNKITKLADSMTDAFYNHLILDDKRNRFRDYNTDNYVSFVHGFGMIISMIGDLHKLDYNPILLKMLKSKKPKTRFVGASFITFYSKKMVPSSWYRLGEEVEHRLHGLENMKWLTPFDKILEGIIAAFKREKYLAIKWCLAYKLMGLIRDEDIGHISILQNIYQELINLEGNYRTTENWKKITSKERQKGKENHLTSLRKNIEHYLGVQYFQDNDVIISADVMADYGGGPQITHSSVLMAVDSFEKHYYGQNPYLEEKEINEFSDAEKVRMTLEDDDSYYNEEFDLFDYLWNKYREQMLLLFVFIVVILCRLVGA